MVAYKSFKTKEKSTELGNLKSRRGRLRERSLTGAFHNKV